MSIHTRFLNPALYEYLIAHSLREDPVLSELREYTASLPEGKMQIAPEQGQLMTLLVKLMNAKNAIEIGVFTGYSSICIARGLQKNGMLIACDTSEASTKVAKQYWQKAGLEEKIDLRLSPAMDTLDSLLEEGRQGQFDIIFIDADKRNYLAYYEASLKLLRSGGLIILDNTLWYGKVADPADEEKTTQALREINTHIFNDKRVEMSLLPIGDGMTLVYKV